MNASMKKSSFKNKLLLSSRPLVRGTLILTVTGLITRVIGFFYRIYLSRLFGEEGMGIYQLIAPVLSLSFSLCAASYQTAISKFVAEYTAQKGMRFRTLFAGLAISIPLSLACTAFLFLKADFIAAKLLMEPRTASMMCILAFSVPFSSIHACINGYFYGVKRTGPPAVSQLIEQLTRVGCVWFVSQRLILSGQTPSINVAILGLTVGELVSMGVCIAAILPVYYARESSKSETASHSLSAHDRSACAPVSLRTGLLSSVFCMALPLTLNRIVLNLLQSVESVSIPARLRLYGYDNATALSIYGVLTGMALPMIFFPNALTNSVSVLLLPMISEDYARGDLSAVKRTIARTLKFCGIMGLCCLSGFFLLGDFMGISLFDSALAGHFIKTLSFLCPFLYLDATLSSILQGLGKTGTIFFMNMIALLLRLAFVFFAIPRFGITGYLWGMLASQIALSLLYLMSLRLFLKKLRYYGKSK